MDNRTWRSRQTRMTVLRAAASEFEAHGYAGGSMTNIVGRLRDGAGPLPHSQATKGTITYYFATKAQIALAIVGEDAAAATRARAQAEELELTGLEALIVAAHLYADHLDRDVVVRSAIRLYRERSVIEVALPDPQARLRRYVEDRLAEARDSGQVRADLDVEGSARHLLAVFLGTFDMSSETGAPPFRCALDAAWLNILPSLGVTDGGMLLNRVLISCCRAGGWDVPTAAAVIVRDPQSA